MKREICYKITSKYNSINDFLREMEYPKTVFVYLRQNEHTTFLNGIETKLYKPLKPDDELRIIINEDNNSNIVPTKPDFNFEDIILYEDEDILVINKPSNVPIHPSIKHHTDTLANYVTNYFNNEITYRCINRLDKDTSGACIIAKNMLSAAILSREVKEKSLKRTYLAIVEGKADKASCIDAPISRVSDSIITRTVDIENGKRAVTHYTRLNSNEKYSLLELQLETGRTHQIRVHMKYINHPIIGDYIYNPNYEDIKRQALHSYKLEFMHPITHKPLEIKAPLPDDMSGIINVK